MRRFLMVIAVACSLFLFDMEDALSRGRGGGSRGGVGRGSRGSSPGGRSSRGSRGNRGRNSTGKSAKELQELAQAEERLAEIQLRRDVLNAEARVGVQEAYAYDLRLEASGALDAEK